MTAPMPVASDEPSIVATLTAQLAVLAARVEQLEARSVGRSRDDHQPPSSAARARSRHRDKCATHGAGQTAVFRHQGSDAVGHTCGKPTGARVLLIDPEPTVLHVVRGNFARHGLRVEGAATGREALAGYPHSRPDVILLDLDLPDMDGCDVIRQVREYTSTPIIVFSGRGQVREQVRVLDLGADDYLAKPFGGDELLARVRVALRHSARLTGGSAAIFRVGDLEVDLERRRVAVDSEEVHLTPIEYALLRVFIAHPDTVLTDRRLLRWVWGDQYGAGDHYLHVYVARLRKKLATGEGSPRYLVTEVGVGYRLKRT